MLRSTRPAGQLAPTPDTGAGIAALDALLARHADAVKRYARAAREIPSARSELVDAERRERAADAATYPTAVIATRDGRAAVEALAREAAAAAAVVASLAPEIVEAWRPIAEQIRPGLVAAQESAETAVRSAAASFVLAVRDLNAARWALGEKPYHAPRIIDPASPDRLAANEDDLEGVPGAPAPYLDEYERLRAAVQAVRESAGSYRKQAAGAEA